MFQFLIFCKNIIFNLPPILAPSKNCIIISQKIAKRFLEKGCVLFEILRSASLHYGMIPAHKTQWKTTAFPFSMFFTDSPTARAAARKIDKSGRKKAGYKRPLSKNE